MAEVFCTNCGRKLDEDARFCSECGTPVAAPVTEPEVEEIPVVQQEPSVEEVALVEEAVPAEEAAPVQQEEPVEEAVPVQEIPEEETLVLAKETKAEKKAKGKKNRGVFRTILAVLLCIVIFAGSLVGTLLTSVRNVVSEDHMEQAIHAVLQDLDSIPAPVEEMGMEDQVDDDATIMDVLVDGTDLRKKEIETFVEKSKTVEAFCETLAAYVSDIQHGTSEAYLDADDVFEFLQKDRNLIYDVTGMIASDRDFEFFVEDMDEVLPFTDAKELKKELSPVYYGIQHGLSVWTAIAVWAIVALLVLLLALVNRWSFVRTSLDAGITLTVSSAIVLLAACLLPTILGMVLGAVPFGATIAALSSYLVGGMVSTSATILAVGVVLILLGCIVNAIAKAIRKHKEAKAAEAVAV